MGSRSAAASSSSASSPSVCAYSHSPRLKMPWNFVRMASMRSAAAPASSVLILGGQLSRLRASSSMNLISSIAHNVSSNIVAYWEADNKPSVHFYNLSAEDAALAIAGMLVLTFVTSVGASVKFVVGTSALFAVALLVYIGVSATGNGLVQDSLLALLCLTLQTVDQERWYAADRDAAADGLVSTFLAVRPCTLVTAYMFALTGLRRRGLIWIWSIGILLRLSLIMSTASWLDLLLYVAQNVHCLLYGLLLYSQIYYVGTEIHRTRHRPRIILQDIPFIIPYELAIFQEFLNHGAEPPLRLTTYEHVSLLLHIPQTREGRREFFTRVAQRSHKSETKQQAQQLQAALHARAAANPRPLERVPESPTEGSLARASSSPSPPTAEQIQQLRTRRRSADQTADSTYMSVGGRISVGASQVSEQTRLDFHDLTSLRTRERLWSLALRESPGDFLVRRRIDENVSSAGNDVYCKNGMCRRVTDVGHTRYSEDPLRRQHQVKWPWHSLDAVIRESNIPVTAVQFQQTIWGSYVDIKLERWFLAWKIVADCRLLVSGQRVLLCQIILGLFSAVGCFNNLLVDIIDHGFRNTLVVVLYVVRQVSYIGVSVLFIFSTRYTCERQKLEWVDLASKTIIRYRLFALFILLSGLLDWIVVAEQTKGRAENQKFFLTRASSYLQSLIMIPPLIAVPPHVLMGVYAVLGVVMILLCAAWPCTLWTTMYDLAMLVSASAASVLFISVPMYKTFRALFATYAAPYLLYLEALKPLDPHAVARPRAPDDQRIPMAGS